jgi:hypothetical protein
LLNIYKTVLQGEIMSEESQAAEAPAVEESGAVENVESIDAGAVEGEAIESQEASAADVENLSTEDTQELKEQVEEAIEEGASEEEVRSMIKQFTLKVNGKEFVKELDLSDEDAIRAELQKAYAGQIAMQEKAHIEKRYASDLQRLQEDPFGVLEEIRGKEEALELAAQRIQQEIERQQMSPEEQAAQEMQRELEDARARLQSMEEEKQRVQHEQLMNEQAELIENDILSAIDEGGLSAEPKTIQRIADAMYWAEENGFGPVSAKDVLPTVKQEMESEFKSYAKSAFTNKEDAIKSLLGEDVLEQLRQQRIESAKKVNNVANLKKPVGKVPESKEEKPKPKIKLSDFMR